MKDVRVRYAPSPTGYLHIGNARTALFNYLFARNAGGKFIIRIEDTDLARNLEDGVESQLENLTWLGIDWDESVDLGGEYAPYNQLARKEAGLYQPFVDQLLEEGKAYKCYCTSEELEAEAERQKAEGKIPKYSGRCADIDPEEEKRRAEDGYSYTIRFKVPEQEVIEWDDMVKGTVSFNSADVSGDFNIVKRDGIPTYNFVVVLDDYLMKISHVLRGEDHISNTPKQIMLYNALGLEVPKFGHMTLIVNEAGKKLSKRDGGILQFISQYKDLGYIPEAMFNFISLLGWSPEGEDEIFSKEELINIFDVNRLSKSAAKFDVNKLTWINNQYMKALDDEKYFELVYPFMNEAYGIENDDFFKGVVLLYKNQISYGQEIVEASKLFFEEFGVSDEAREVLEAQEEGNVKALREALVDGLGSLQEFDVASIKTLIKEIGKSTGIKGKGLFQPIRLMVTGEMHGPELADVIVVLGKDRVLEHLEKSNN